MLCVKLFSVAFTRQVKEKEGKCIFLIFAILNKFFEHVTFPKTVTHLAILFADRSDRRKSPGVTGAAMAIFADRRDRRLKSPISGMSDVTWHVNSLAFAKCAHSRDFLPSSLRITPKVNQSGWAILSCLSHDFQNGGTNA